MFEMLLAASVGSLCFFCLCFCVATTTRPETQAPSALLWVARALLRAPGRAAMLDAAIGLDVRHEGGGDDGDGGVGARGWDGAGTPRHWEIEGRGGHFWYEQAGRR